MKGTKQRKIFKGRIGSCYDEKLSNGQKWRLIGEKQDKALREIKEKYGSSTRPVQPAQDEEAA